MGNCCVRVQLTRNRMTQRKRKRKIVLLLVGLDKAGKTTAAKGLVGEQNSGTVPTVGFSTFSQAYKGYSVVIYDIGGGPQIRGIWNKYFIDVHGIIYVVDASDAPRIEESRLILQQLLTHDKLAGKPLLLLANKQDCEGALDEIDIVERLKLERIVNQQKCPTLVETCTALTTKSASHKSHLDPGIQNGYRWLLSIIIKEFKSIDARVEADTELAQIELKKEKEERKKRLDELRREREEIEGTIIIPLRDYSSEDSKLIQVKTSSIDSEDPNMTNGSTEVKVNHLSDSHDSGYTVQNIEDHEDVVSVRTVLSEDSAVQSIKARENLNMIEHNESIPSSPPSNDIIVQESKENHSKPTKAKRFLRHSNKTAPAPTGVLLLGKNDSEASSTHHRHKLPPLTPPANRTKMFEAKSAKPARLLKSLSLSSSDDSDERSTTRKPAFLINSATATEDMFKVYQPKQNAYNDISIEPVSSKCPNGRNSNETHKAAKIITENREMHNNNIFDVFTVRAPSSS